MVRYLELEEKQKVLPLYQKCFDDTEEYCNYYFEKRLPQNEVAVEEDKGMIHLIPKKINQQETCHYLYAVATSPDFRKQGVMGRILKKVLQDLYKKGESFTYLIPSSEENAQIYRKYGFSRVMDKKVLKPEESRKKDLAQVTMRSAVKRDIEVLVPFAQSTMERKYTIYISKDRKYFEDIFELMEIEGGDITIYEKDGDILGYRIGFEDDVLEEVLDDSIKEYAWEGEMRKPYTMARVLNISHMLKTLETKTHGHVYVQITDPVIEANNGMFLWEFGLQKFTGGSLWQRVEDSGNCLARVCVSVEDFSAHIMGYKKVENLPEMNVKQGFFIPDYV